MKIEWMPPSILSKTSSKEKNRTEGGAEFKKIMDQYLEEEKNTQAISTDSSSQHGINPLSGLSIPLNPQQQRDTEIISQITQLLDEVDFYAQKLGDTSIPAIDLAPLITHLEERAEALMEYSSSGKVGGRLEQIISDLALTISSEVAKFKRGDYQ